MALENCRADPFDLETTRIKFRQGCRAINEGRGCSGVDVAIFSETQKFNEVIMVHRDVRQTEAPIS